MTVTRKSIEQFVDEIEFNESWMERYCNYVPKIIEEAKNKQDWKDWDTEIFKEFFEETVNCVSSLKQGKFTPEEKENIKSHWSEISPLLKILAENQESPNWIVYNEIKTIIRKYTANDQRAATNRIIASLQPFLLCTIIAEKKLHQFFKLLKKYSENPVPDYIGGDWFRNSYNIQTFILNEVKSAEKMHITTYAWKIFDSLKNLDKINTQQPQLQPQSKQQSKMNDYITQLQESKNIIFTGAPGTGKTYLAKQIAMQMILGYTKKESELSDEEQLTWNEHFSFAQFHPSYDYTNFVEGLKTDEINGQIIFNLHDGIFKSFCKRAISSQLPYVFIIDEINRGEISKIFGELFFSIDPGYRGKDGKVQTQYANIQSDETIFDNNSGKGWFYVPENVYIIGTMNDIDRSVESFDFAMRRRFTWLEITAEQSAENMQLEENSKKRMLNLNKAIDLIPGLNSSYHIGGSYFLKSIDYDKLWDYRLKPLLSEYLRGMSDVEENLKKLNDAYNLNNKTDENDGQ